MIALGISGGLDQVQQNREYLFTPGICHDSAAVLVEDGRVVAAIEEERLNRIKHSSKGAVKAIRYCLQTRGIALSELDAVVYYGSEEGCSTWMRNLFYSNRDAQPVRTYRELIHECVLRGVGEDLDDSKLFFVNHHLAHAIGAYAHSGFDESLVLTIDGAGDGLCGSITMWRGSNYDVLATYPEAKSLGTFYDRVIAIIGYGFTEEYKVMGLAPYGNPNRFRRAFEPLYTLLPGGDYTLNWHLFDSLFSLVPVRKRGEAITQDHKDIAAALQEALERVVFHVLSHCREATGMRNLCLAGGVAHNSTLNGKLLYSGMFHEIFVHPAANDSGCAVGAALYPFYARAVFPSNPTPAPRARIDNVYWGTSIGSSEEIGARLARWRPLIEVREEKAIESTAATLLDAGKVIGWVQGRSEFGPRALGNRSIVADPRPASNKDLINSMVKKREGYRPFAPAVLEEYAHEYFEIPRKGMTFPFMSFTVRVRSQWRERLGAVSHVDHTARVQTVSRRSNPEFWGLIEAFRELTGVAVLLNTSFNNNAEPIVDSIDDAVACFLTTGLQYLVIGDTLVSKRDTGRLGILDLHACLPQYARLDETTSLGSDGRFECTHRIGNSYDRNSVQVSASVYQILRRSGAGESVADALGGYSEGAQAVAEELWELWGKRVVTMVPCADSPEGRAR